MFHEKRNISSSANQVVQNSTQTIVEIVWKKPGTNQRELGVSLPHEELEYIART